MGEETFTASATTKEQNPEMVEAKSVAALLAKTNKRCSELAEQNRSMAERLEETEKRTKDMMEAYQAEVKAIKQARSTDYGSIIEGDITVEDMTSANGKLFLGPLYEKRLKGSDRPRPTVYEKLMTAKPFWGSKALYGDGLKQLRILNDYCYLEAALLGEIKTVGQKTYVNEAILDKLTYFNEWQKLSNHFQKALGMKALSTSTGSHYGSDWVPTAMSSEVIQLIELEPGLANFFRRIAMTTGNTYTIPRMDGRETAYYVGESTLDESPKIPGKPDSPRLCDGSRTTARYPRTAEAIVIESITIFISIVLSSNTSHHGQGNRGYTCDQSERSVVGSSIALIRSLI